MTHMPGGDKTTVELRAVWIKEEDQKPFHQLCELQFKSTQSTRQTVSPRKKNVLDLAVLDTEGKINGGPH